MTFEIALTGLHASSAELEVISNNIANSSTVGFKASEIKFGDIYGTEGIGSTGNSIGRGVRVTDVVQQFSKGDVTYTESQLDLSVGGSGQGFFKLSDNGAVQYSKAGSFGLDRDGYIVNGAGQKLMGYPAVDGDILPTPGELRVASIDTAARQTESVRINLNLNADDEIASAAVPFDNSDSDTYSFTTSTTFYDSLGASHLANLHFRKSDTNTWNMHTYIGDTDISSAGDEIVFNADGSLNNINGDTSGMLSLDSFVPLIGTDPLNVTMDLSDMTQFFGQSGVNEIAQDGYGSGRLNDFGITAEGMIQGYYSNGQSAAMGQITVTNFRNPQGLQQVGNTSWEETFASGEALTGTPGSATLGTIEAGSLEQSNVDVTDQLVKMISTQRNFQANAQVISAGDQLTQTVMNIKR